MYETMFLTLDPPVEAPVPQTPKFKAPLEGAENFEYDFTNENGVVN